MILTSVRVEPKMSTLSSTAVYTMTITMPYRHCCSGLNAACTARMIRSNTIMVADTGRWNHLLSTSGGMSMPPVEAPARMVMRSEVRTPRWC